MTTDRSSMRVNAAVASLWAALIVMLGLVLETVRESNPFGQPVAFEAGPPIRLRLGFELPGRTVLFQEYNHFEGAPQSTLMLRFRGETTRIDGIRGLRGHVRIRNAQDALTFCRVLSTAALRAGGEPTEVVTRTGLRSLPDFGVPHLRERLTELRTRPVFSGYEGVIDNKDLRVVGRLAPKVTAVPGGYLVRRQLVDILAEPPRLMVVEEHVAVDGAYTRHTVQSRLVPRKSGSIRWDVFHPR